MKFVKHVRQRYSKETHLRKLCEFHYFGLNGNKPTIFELLEVLCTIIYPLYHFI